MGEVYDYPEVFRPAAGVPEPVHVFGLARWKTQTLSRSSALKVNYNPIGGFQREYTVAHRTGQVEDYSHPFRRGPRPYTSYLRRITEGIPEKKYKNY